MIARARPLLGTLVSIRADATEAGLQAAFDAVARVEALMSAHAATSDVARIYREAHERPVPVHPWTARVLRFARAVSRASAGAFDVTLGRGGASHRDVLLLPGSRVRLRRPMRIDLGGIAKGFAVDRAVQALRRAGARSGIVNAGGDLRVFGPAAERVHVRLPARPNESVALAVARNRAFATSAGYFRAEGIDARTGAPLYGGASVTVTARTCMAADALTKAIAALGPDMRLLARFGARAWLVDDQGRPYAARR
ncbi:MAG: FAD:protein FMN transferase [Clostridia bacterium]